MNEGPLSHKFDTIQNTVAVAWAGFALTYLVLGRPMTVVIDLTVVTVTLLFKNWGRSTGKLELAIHRTILASALGLTGAALLSGQSQSMAVWYLVAAPLMAGYLLSVKAAVKWAVISAGLIMFVDGSEYLYQIPPEFVPQGWELTSGRLCLVAVLLIFGVATRLANDHQLSLLAQREQELLKAQHAAEQANLAKTRFLSTVGHELRTPLNAILGFNQMLSDEIAGPLNSKQHRYLGNVQEGGKKLHRLIEDVLSFSRLDLDGETPTSRNVSVTSVISEVRHRCQSKASLAQLEFDIEIDDTNLFTDRERLSTILYQLLDNAIKFTPSGGTIAVRSCQRGDCYQLSISDTGIGLSAEEAEQMFLPFHQKDGSLSRDHAGTGLGLALSRKLAQSLGGRLYLQASETQGGATFVLELPENTMQTQNPEGPI